MPTDDEILRQPARLETTEDRVWFRTGNETFPAFVFVIWDGGDRVAVTVASHSNPDGASGLITIDDTRRMHEALGLILDHAEAPS
jgi:hypothetical protein